MRQLSLSFAVFISLVIQAAAQNAPQAPPPCSPSVNGLNFICGIVNPEDLVHIPQTRWLIASGYDPGGGLLAGSRLKLVDTTARTFTQLYDATPAQVQPDRAKYPGCTSAPPADLATHGLYLRPAGAAGQFTLYAVTHSPRETVEIFSVDATAQPRATWRGCLTMPEGLRGNGVAVFSDGAVLVTIPNAGRPAADGAGGGTVLEWKPGQAAFQRIPGTELPSNNGIEISLDEKEFFVVGFSEATVYVFARNNPSRPIRSAKAPGFVPDNLRWSGQQLIATGPMYDEPLCGGTRREASQIPGGPRGPGGGCNRGYMAAALDPATMTWKVLAYAEPNPQIGIISAGVVVGDTLWIGAALSPGLAYRPLPRPAVSGTRP